MFVQVIKRGYGCELAVHVMEALLEGPKKGGPRDVCVCMHAISSVGVSVCMPILFTLPFSRQLLVYVCVYVCKCVFTPLNDYDYTRQVAYCS